jgi:RND family efflux transporter MFP subunit
MSTIRTPVAPESTGEPAAPASTGGHDELAELRIDRRDLAGPHRLRRTALVVAGLILLGGLTAAYAVRDKLTAARAVTTDSARVMTIGQANSVLTATGYLESRLQAAVGARAPGRIAQIPVEEGSVVRAGELLAELEHADLDATLESRRVAVRQAEAELAESEFQLAQAERDLMRERDVYQRRAGTVAAVEKAETAYEAAKAIHKARVAMVAAAKAHVVEAEEAIRNMFVYAPFDGTIISKDAEQGESIMPGGLGVGSGRGSVVTLANLKELEVDTDVKEDYLGLIRKGQPAQITVDAVPDRRYRGQLREVIPMGDRTRGIVKVKVTVLDPDERLFPELSATVDFLPLSMASDEEAQRALSQAVFVPRDAVVGEGEAAVVWRVEDVLVRRTPVRAGEAAGKDLIHIEDGLKGGETIVVDPPPDLQDGLSVSLGP